MSKKSFEYFGRLSRHLDDPTLIAGRYAFQKPAEKKILFDVIRKLRLENRDSLLEIGCGVGNLLIPLSFIVDKVTGIDHPDCLDKLETR